ncbi:MAG: hypothetical protein K2Q26_15855 [Bdellovibrionales bacterium]|nr:hypothetical protein [Bdellovibrionales bacterium]
MKKPKTVHHTISEDLVRSELRKLPRDMKQALIQRFWHLETIYDISRHLGKTWEETDHLLKEGLNQIKQGPISNYFMDLASENQIA